MPLSFLGDENLPGRLTRAIQRHNARGLLPVDHVKDARSVKAVVLVHGARLSTRAACVPGAKSSTTDEIPNFFVRSNGCIHSTATRPA